MMDFQLQTGEISLQGGRNNNQDRCVVLEDRGTVMLVVGDGLGGHPKGDVAAQILINICQQFFVKVIKPVQSPQQLMKACLIQAHKAIIEYGHRQNPKIFPRTTAVIAIIQQNKAYWLHVGDSRLYLIRDRMVAARTRDHSVSELGNADISELVSNLNPNAITRCLGGDPEPPIASISKPMQLRENDFLLLCTDGFWGPLDTETIIQGLQEGNSLQLAISRLAAKATQKHPQSSDNATAVVAHLEPKETA